MKIGIISDIHGNIFGLNAVLAGMGVCDRIIACGDFTGYYCYANEVFEALKYYDVTAVRGNHDEYLLTGAYRTMPEHIRLPLAHTERTIHREYLKLLAGLPGTVRFSAGDGSPALITHGSPWDPFEEYVYPDYEGFERFERLPEDTFLLGHTHYPFLKNTGGKTIVNPGSCGQPRDYNPDASACIWDTEKRMFSFLRVPYDKDELVANIRSLGMPERLVTILIRTHADGG